jgi:plastocyanin
MRLSTMAAGLFSLSLAMTAACSSSDSGGGSTGGTSGGTGGSSGAGGSATGGSSGAGGSNASGGSSGDDAGGGTFTAVPPCSAATDYVEGTTVNFPGAGGLTYDPKCLKVKAGATVKFTGMFASHPLSPSLQRGDKTDNPIKETKTGTEASFTFPKAGNFAYFCEFHGAGDGNMFMVGNIWVTP